MKWLCLGILITVSIAACGRPSHVPGQDRAIASVSCSSGIAEPWSCLQSACAIAGGKFNSATRECTCRPGRAFTGWSKPSCSYRYAQQSSTTVSVMVLKSKVSVEVPQDLDIADVSSQFAVANVPTFASTRNLYFNPLPQTLTGLKAERLLFWAPPQVSFNFPLTIPTGDFFETVFYSNAEQLLSILSANDQFDPEHDSVPSQLKYSKEIAAALSAREFREQVSPFTELGCLGACVVNRVLSVNEFPQYAFVQTTLWSGGVPYRNVTRISEPGKLPFAAVVQSPRGRPLLFMEFDGSNSPTKGERNATFYSLTGAAIGQFKNESDYSLVTNVQAADRADILMCESNFGETWQNSALLNSVRRGPLKADQFTGAGGSKWGWFNASSEKEFYSGVRPVSELGFLDYSDMEDPAIYMQREQNYHGEFVLRAILTKKYSDLTVAPMGPTECSQQQILKSGLPAQQLPRIINYSTGESRTQSACKAAYPELATTPFLWVFAAGNEGYEGMEQSLTICPQSSVPRTKKIIVGATDYVGEVLKFSNRNSQYVDIYAFGGSCEENQELCQTQVLGTSFAAPKVSAVAARIAKKYPQLTNDQIRIAILMGADTSSGLPALSRGSLDEKGALDFAAKILTTRSLAEAVKASCPNKFWSCRSWNETHLAILNDVLQAN